MVRRIATVAKLSVIPPRKRGSRGAHPSRALDPRFRGGINEELGYETCITLRFLFKYSALARAWRETIVRGMSVYG
jgi:hypothetical protein